MIEVPVLSFVETRGRDTKCISMIWSMKFARKIDADIRNASLPLKRRTKNEPRLAVPSCHGRR